MSSDTITMIVVSLVGALISILIAAVAFFIARTYGNNDKKMDRIDVGMEKHSSALTTLASGIEKLVQVIDQIQKEFKMRHDGFEQTLSQHREIFKQHHNEIEMLRKRTHDADNNITKIFLKGEMMCGWGGPGSVISLANGKPTKGET